MSNGETPEVQLARLFERVGTLHDKADRLHRRQDTLEREVRDELRMLRDRIEPLVNFHQRAIGVKAAGLTIAALLGGVIVRVFDHFWSGP